MIDRDCNRKNHAAKLAERIDRHRKLLGCLALSEVEVWMLAVQPANALPASFGKIRKHCDPKEEFAEPYLAAQGWTLDVGRGRKRAMQEMAGRKARLLTLCPELNDLKAELAARL